MAESRVIFSGPTPARVAPLSERSIEDIRDALDAWLRAENVAREARVRPVALGYVCTLYESAHAVAVERGTTSDLAIEHGLEKVGAL